MFEQAFLAAASKPRTGWTLLASFTLQCSLVALAILIPLLHPDMLPLILSMDVFPVVAPPPARPAAPDPAPVQMVRATVRQPNGSELIEPTRIPNRTAQIIDPPPDYGRTGGENGVPEGVPWASQNSFVDSLLRSARQNVKPPPPPVVKETVSEAPRALLRVSEGVQRGRCIHEVIPEYPVMARTIRLEGNVVVHAIIGRDGTVTSLQAVSGHPLLVPAALQAVRQWRFLPTLLSGVPVAHVCAFLSLSVCNPLRTQERFPVFGKM
jgi:protein TonB